MEPIGKYGSMALNYLKENHDERYKELSETNTLIPLMQKVNEDAHDKVDFLIKQYLKKNPLTNPIDTMSTYKEKLQARDYAEEIILKEFIYQIR